MNKKKRKK